ncbi:MAG TPA: pilin, partial [Hydrogenophaga sp.]
MLIELMLVVSIIGILAAVALPAYSDYTTRSRVTEALEFGVHAQKAVLEFHDRWGVMPENNRQAGLPDAQELQGQYVEGIDVLAGGMVRLRLRASILGRQSTDMTAAAAPQAPYLLYMRPAIPLSDGNSSVAWVCQMSTAPQGFRVGALPDDGGQRLENRFLPSVCRGG